jgi:hypothetical protein
MNVLCNVVYFTVTVASSERVLKLIWKKNILIIIIISAFVNKNETCLINTVIKHINNDGTNPANLMLTLFECRI